MWKKDQCVFARAKDLVTTNNKCVLHSLRYTCFNGSWHFILFRLALHAIKCVDYKVVAIDLILMLVRALSLAHQPVRLRLFNLMSITLQTGHFNKLPLSNEKCWKFTWYFGCFSPRLLHVFQNVGIVATANSDTVLTFFFLSFVVYGYMLHATKRCNPIHYFIVAVWLSLILSGGFSNCKCIQHVDWLLSCFQLKTLQFSRHM